jgi:hypothetical protein
LTEGRNRGYRVPDADELGPASRAYYERYRNRLAGPRARANCITLAEIWVLPKEPDGQPPHPQSGPCCTKQGCHRASTLRYIRADNQDGNAGRHSTFVDPATYG